MRPLLFALPLLTAASVFAQQQQFPVPNAKTHSFTDGAPRPIAVCPLSLFARQQGSPQTLWTIALEDLKSDAIILHPNRPPAGYGVHVDLSQPTSDTQASDRISSMVVQVFYLAPATRAIPLTQSRDRIQLPPVRTTLSKTFRLNTDSAALLHLEADLLVGPASGISRVHLFQVDYADGHFWNAPNTTACSTTPSLYVPVTN